MSNMLNNGSDKEFFGSDEVVTVSFVDREGNVLAEQDYAKGSIDDARRIPRGNRVPYVDHPEWRLQEISADGRTWIIDVVN